MLMMSSSNSFRAFVFEPGGGGQFLLVHSYQVVEVDLSGHVLRLMTIAAHPGMLFS
jgi:hypothetical protein